MFSLISCSFFGSIFVPLCSFGLSVALLIVASSGCSFWDLCRGHLVPQFCNLQSFSELIKFLVAYKKNKIKERERLLLGNPSYWVCYCGPTVWITIQ